MLVVVNDEDEDATLRKRMSDSPGDALGQLRARLASGFEQFRMLGSHLVVNWFSNTLA